MRNEHNILAVKLSPGALAFGGEQVLISEIFPQSFTPGELRARLEDIHGMLPLAEIYVAGQGPLRTRENQALYDCTLGFAKENGLSFAEVAGAHYRGAFTGNTQSSGAMVLEEATRLNLGARTVAEAEAIALYHFALDGIPPSLRVAQQASSLRMALRNPPVSFFSDGREYA
ncbi:hypothetical protein GB927_016625 [Shinella sp. CPCC 100929]|uniref:Uncharacterized protein n=1 Tax=Shinella lacus TaxID=2654216 RepID=A0ABT1R915_9HYPH|nr:hypothetical protein [Shinella lacus]MCQ4631678.1 hypothetical protein [Shinella lacus]